MASGPMLIPTFCAPCCVGADIEQAMDTWQEHVAMLLSNRTKGWTQVVTAIGDALYRSGRIADAHFWCVLSV